MNRLWAITSYFNPMRYRRRLQNYLTFRRRLTVPLVAVEFADGDDFELPSDAADVLLRLKGTDVLWQKERLLNLALANGVRRLARALGREADGIACLRMSPEWAAHYRAWACGHFRRVGAAIGCTDGTVTHLWHGDLKHRRYSERHGAFSAYQYSPITDIALDGNGAWRWNSRKPEMHAFVADYFRSGREDGDQFVATPARSRNDKLRSAVR